MRSREVLIYLFGVLMYLSFAVFIYVCFKLKNVFHIIDACVYMYLVSGVR